MSVTPTSFCAKNQCSPHPPYRNTYFLSQRYQVSNDTPYTDRPTKDTTSEPSPQMMASARERNDVIVVPRYDICLDHDMMVIEIQLRCHQPVLVVNIYNPPCGSTGTHSTGQRLKLLDLPGTYPTMIAGDFCKLVTARERRGTVNILSKIPSDCA